MALAASACAAAFSASKLCKHYHKRTSLGVLRPNPKPKPPKTQFHAVQVPCALSRQLLAPISRGCRQAGRVLLKQMALRLVRRRLKRNQLYAGHLDQDGLLLLLGHCCACPQQRPLGVLLRLSLRLFGGLQLAPVNLLTVSEYLYEW